MADRVLRLLVDIQIDRCADECWNTLPIPWKQNQEAYQLRYVGLLHQGGQAFQPGLLIGALY